MAAHCKVEGLFGVSCTKKSEATAMLFGMWTGVGPRKHVLDGAAHWRNLVNTTELPICGGNAAFCQITLTNYYYLVLH